MPRKLSVLLMVSSVLVAVAGCEPTKSSNPLSPTVAGPIPGVNITPPMPLEPRAVKVPVDRQPVTLVVENAASNGQRPLSYVFEVATDAGFANIVWSRTGVTPGEGRTTMRLPDPLATGRSYYWRARAEDGANTGPYSAAGELRRLHADRDRTAATGLTGAQRHGHQPAAHIHLQQRGAIGPGRPVYAM